MRLAPWLIALLGLGLVVYGLSLRWKHPPRVTGMSSIQLTAPKTGRPVSFRTRTVDAAGFTRSEVELPGGTWVECAAGDCARTVRDEYFEVFEALREKGN